MRVRAILGAALIATCILWLPGLVSALRLSATREFDDRPSATREYQTIVRHLQARFDGYGSFDTFTSDFRVVALSHMASGMLNVFLAEPDKREEVRRSVSEIVRRALSANVSPIGTPTSPSARMDGHNLFWSHLGLILGVDRVLRCPRAPCAIETEGDRLQERIVTHLRDRTLQSGVFHVPSYPGSPMYPADQAVTLLAIKLYDVVSGTSLHEEPLRGYLRVLKQRADPKTGLFPSSLSPISNASLPRGCATSWTVLYLAQLDEAAAFDQYTRAREALGASVLGVGGFREWPPGRGGGADVDSGPIVLGVGVAATALGLGPARIFRDERTYAIIRRAALTFGVPAWSPSGGYLTAPLLGDAILFDGRTAHRWFGTGRGSAVEPRRVPVPTAPAVLTLLDVALLLAGVKAVVPRRRALPAGARSGNV